MVTSMSPRVAVEQGQVCRELVCLETSQGEISPPDRGGGGGAENGRSAPP